MRNTTVLPVRSTPVGVGEHVRAPLEHEADDAERRPALLDPPPVVLDRAHEVVPSAWLVAPHREAVDHVARASSARARGGSSSDLGCGHPPRRPRWRRRSPRTRSSSARSSPKRAKKRVICSSEWLRSSPNGGAQRRRPARRAGARRPGCAAGRRCAGRRRVDRPDGTPPPALPGTDVTRLPPNTIGMPAVRCSRRSSTVVQSAGDRVLRPHGGRNGSAGEDGSPRRARHPRCNRRLCHLRSTACRSEVPTMRAACSRR